jgi:hypothetical protein
VRRCHGEALIEPLESEDPRLSRRSCARDGREAARHLSRLVRAGRPRWSDATLWHFQIRVETAYALLGILAGLNRLYFTTFQFKKMRRFVGQMQVKPERLAERLEDLFQQTPAIAAKSLEALTGEVLALDRARNARRGHRSPAAARRRPASALGIQRKATLIIPSASKLPTYGAPQ